MKSAPTAAPRALLRLGAHHPGPARVELEYQPAVLRFALALGSWALCWGALPFLIWIPPHYPWVTVAFLAGIYLPYHFWTGKYRVRSFAGSCPRCGKPLHLASGTKIDLPHKLTCFDCHFEPRLEVGAGVGTPTAAVRIGHRRAHCTGSWNERWIRDETWVVCDACTARHPATDEARRVAAAENECGALLERLTGEGRFLP